MEIPTKLRHLEAGNTLDNQPRDSVFVQGQPGVGKTLLLAEMALKLAKCEPKDVMCVIYPVDDEGLKTLRDRKFPWFMARTNEALKELYEDVFLKLKPAAVIQDNLGAAWWMTFKDRVSDGLMPEDHGKTWNKLASDIMYDVVTRFKTPSWVKFFGAGSLAMPYEDVLTVNQDKPRGKGAPPPDEKLQTTLPGQLRGTIYGLFSYCLTLKMAVGEAGRVMRCAETQLTANSVSKVRAPLSQQPKKNILYDLASPDRGIDFLLRELKLV